MKKLFVSQPMKGRSDEKILNEREYALQTAKVKLKDEVELVDSFFQGAPADARPLWFLGKSLQLLSTADVIYFVPGWENARGCMIEYACAKAYNIPILMG